MMDERSHAARVVEASLLLLVVGAALVVLDFDINDIPLVPDGLGYVLVAVGAARLTQVDRDAAGGVGPLGRAGAALCLVAIVSALDWLAAILRLRPPPGAAVGGAAWVDAVLFVATVATGVMLLRELSRWFAARDLHPAAQRLRVTAHVLGWPWGAFALLSLVAAAVLPGGEHLTLETETPLVIPVILGMLGTLVYGAWAVLSARAELRRVGQDSTGQPSGPG